MKPVSLFVLLFAGLFLSLPAAAERMYKVIGQDGSVTYTTQAPDTSNAASIETTNISGGVGDDGSSADQQRVASAHPVTLYSVGNCPSCDHARAWLKQHGIPFADKDVNKDLTARAELKQRSGALVVPTILVGKEVLKGYTEPVLESELAKAGYPVGKNAPGNAQGDEGQGPDQDSMDQGDQGDNGSDSGGGQ
jgi:glutaredoxin